MRFRPHRSAQTRAVLSAICAITLLSGFAVFTPQGRSNWDILSVLFVIGSGIALLFMLQAISAMAQRTMTGGYRDSSKSENHQAPQSVNTDSDSSE